MSNNSIFNLLCRGRTSPLGWGFPPVDPSTEKLEPTRLRALLCFLQDDDGNAQLIRWYHAMIRNFPGVWRSLAGPEEGYNPHWFHKPNLESLALQPGRSLVTGTMELNWIPTIETTSLTGILQDGALVLGSTTYPAQLQDGGDDRSELVLPPELGCRVSVLTAPTAGACTLVLRPRSFSATSVIEKLKIEAAEELNQAGLLDSFLSLPRPEDKLAVAWLALAKIESLP